MMPLSIVYEDNDLLVVDKTAGLTDHPAPGHPSHTLINAVPMFPVIKIAALNIVKLFRGNDLAPTIKS